MARGKRGSLASDSDHRGVEISLEDSPERTSVILELMKDAHSSSVRFIDIVKMQSVAADNDIARRKKTRESLRGRRPELGAS